MDKKEDLEKKIKQDLMQKDKERIIDLYLQIKFEKDIFEQQVEELKAENERLREDRNFLIKEISTYSEPLLDGVKFDISNDDIRFQIVSSLCDRNHEHIEKIISLKQQLKEKDEEIERLMSGEHIPIRVAEQSFKMRDELIKENTKQVCEKIRKNASCATLMNGDMIICKNYSISEEKLQEIEKGEEC